MLQDYLRAYYSIAFTKQEKGRWRLSTRPFFIVLMVHYWTYHLN